MSDPLSHTAHAHPLAPGEVVVHRNVVLLETDDPTLLAEIQQDARVRSAIVAQLSPQVALVRREAAARFIEILRKAGHTPKVHET